jgi:hypothetical protein
MTATLSPKDFELSPFDLDYIAAIHERMAGAADEEIALAVHDYLGSSQRRASMRQHIRHEIRLATLGGEPAN